MAENGQRIAFLNEDTNETDYFFVLDQTTINGKNYLLVVDRMEGDLEEDEDGQAIVPCEALILEEKAGENEEEVVYEVVDDDATLAIISNVFQEQIENLEIEL